MSHVNPVAGVPLERDLLDAATIAVPSLLLFDALVGVIHEVNLEVQRQLSSHMVVPFGSYATGSILKLGSDLDLAVVGPGEEHHTAVQLAAALSASGKFVVRAKPLTHSSVKPLLRFTHIATSICGDITFNPIHAIWTSGQLAARARAFPVAVFLNVIIKALARGAKFSSTVINSISISIAAFGLVRAMTVGELPEGGPPTVPTLSQAFLAFIKFFGVEMLARNPQSIVVTLDGVRVVEPTSRFLTWTVVEPATGDNVAERCVHIRRFAELLQHVHDAVIVHYVAPAQFRLPGTHHILQLIPELRHVMNLSDTQTDAAEVQCDVTVESATPNAPRTFGARPSSQPPQGPTQRPCHRRGNTVALGRAAEDLTPPHHDKENDAITR